MYDPVCVCGHAEDEHGSDPKHPGSTACCVSGCKCDFFELDGCCDDDECDCHRDPFNAVDDGGDDVDDLLGDEVETV